MKDYRAIGLKSIFLFVSGMVLIFFINACSKMDSTYHEYWKDGEIVYPAFPDSLRVYPGKNRVKMRWLAPNDLTIDRTIFYWNNRQDSLVTKTAELTQVGKWYEVLIDNLAEGNYSFIAYSFDGENNRSVVADAVGEVYGETYESSLLDRLITEASFSGDSLTVQFGDRADETSLGSEVKYKNDSDKTKVLFVLAEEDLLVLKDFKYTKGSSIEYRTVFVPDSMAIDTFYTPFQKKIVMGPRINLPKDNWAIAEISSYDDRASSDRDPENLIDGDITNEWANQINTIGYPHHFIVDMGEVIEGVRGVSIHIDERNESPKVMTIYGGQSSDGSDLTPIQTFGVENKEGWQYFDFDNAGDFRTIKYEFTEGYGSMNLIMHEIGVFTRE